MQVSRLVRKHREAMGLTQAQLAARAGVSRPTVENIERGISEPCVNTAKKIAAVFRIPWGDFFAGPNVD